MKAFIFANKKVNKIFDINFKHQPAFLCNIDNSDSSHLLGLHHVEEIENIHHGVPDDDPLSQFPIRTGFHDMVIPYKNIIAVIIVKDYLKEKDYQEMYSNIVL